jgi:thiol-disulfide isomerase/thioredoxin
MKCNRLFLFAVPLMVLLAAACSNNGETHTTPEAIVENAVFTDLDGNEVSVKDFKGKFVMIDFWESWCGPCLQVFPSLQELREEFPDQFEVLAVTVGVTEGPEDARRFSEEHDYDFNWLYDQNGIFNQLGGQSIPFKAYLDPDGNFIKVELGSHGREGDYNRTKAMIQEYF